MQHGDGLARPDLVADFGLQQDADRQVDRFTFAFAAAAQQDPGAGDGQRIQARHVASAVDQKRALQAGRGQARAVVEGGRVATLGFDHAPKRAQAGA